MFIDNDKNSANANPACPVGVVQGVTMGRNNMRVSVLAAAVAAACVGVGGFGQAALAQATSVPVANQPKQCQELARKGFTIHSETISRSGTSSAQVATQARPGSYAPHRKYGEGGNNKWFIDSFPAHGDKGCRICGVWVTVKGMVNPNNLNNDSVTIAGANTTGPQLAGSPLAWSNADLKLAGSTAPLPQGAYSSGFMIEGPAYMNWYLASPNPWIDVMVQDDTQVDAVSVTYFFY